MSARYKDILESYTKIVIKNDDYTVEGLLEAYKQFCESLAVKTYKPQVAIVNKDAYVKTTLAEAIARAKQPVVIPVQKNKYNNWESTVRPGLIFEERNVSDGPEPKMQYVCVGVQDGDKIAPLSMNQLRVCQANGWRFDAKNTVGCAKTVTTDLAMK